MCLLEMDRASEESGSDLWLRKAKSALASTSHRLNSERTRCAPPPQEIVHEGVPLTPRLVVQTPYQRSGHPSAPCRYAHSRVREIVRLEVVLFRVVCVTLLRWCCSTERENGQLDPSPESFPTASAHLRTRARRRRAPPRPRRPRRVSAAGFAFASVGARPRRPGHGHRRSEG